MQEPPSQASGKPVSSPRRVVATAVAAFATMGLAPAAHAQCVSNENGILCDLQTLSISDEFTSEAFGLSGDGRILVGRGTPSQRAWMLDDQFDASFIGLPGSAAFAASADGSVIVGEADSQPGIQAFRWTAAGGMEGLGDVPGFFFGSSAADVSDDGSVVVGTGTPGPLESTEAFRWTPATGLVGLGSLPGGDQTSTAFAVSGDGTVIVGGSGSNRTIGEDREAFRWTQAGGMQALGDLDGGAFASGAVGVSADGSVIVGQGVSGFGPEAFRWEGGVMTPLGDLTGGNFWSLATDVTADGRIVVGTGAVRIADAGFDFFHPFVWDAQNGMRDLLVVLNDLGLALPNLEPTVATAISDDGTVIAGFGASAFRTPAGDTRTEAWIAVLAEPVPEPGSGLACAATFLTVVGLARARAPLGRR